MPVAVDPLDRERVDGLRRSVSGRAARRQSGGDPAGSDGAPTRLSSETAAQTIERYDKPRESQPEPDALFPTDHFDVPKQAGSRAIRGEIDWLRCPGDPPSDGRRQRRAGRPSRWTRGTRAPIRVTIS